MANEPWPVFMPFEMHCACLHDQDFIPYVRNGHNHSISGTPEDLWTVGGVRTLPSAAANFVVTSNSVNDTAAGTGARTIIVYYLDSDYNSQNEIITLNGTSDVTSTGSALRIQSMITVTAGSGGCNAGDITASIGGDVQCEIANETGPCNRSLQAIHTVPANYDLIITNLIINLEDGGDMEVNVDVKTETSDIWITQLDFDIAGGSTQFANFTPFRIPTKSDYRIQAHKLAGSDKSVSASVIGWLVHTSRIGSNTDLTIGF